MHDIGGKKVGIWGLGVFGKSLAHFLATHKKVILSLYDSKKIVSLDDAQLKQWNASLYSPDTLSSFLQENEYIFPSSGIDLRPYQAYKHKFISELDFFYAYWKKPVIAITGTIGKTTITSTLNKIFELTHQGIALGGNIGIGLPDLLMLDSSIKGALLELSSFQLELGTQGAPDLAVITNIYPNHLDRHDTFDHYFQSKFRMIALQSAHQRALIPLELSPYVYADPILSVRKYAFFIDRALAESDYQMLVPGASVYYCNDEGRVYKYTQGVHVQITDEPLPSTSYQVNWLIVAAILDLMNMPTQVIAQYSALIAPPEHRLACIAEHAGIFFYNDSKATVFQSMLAAVKKLSGKPIVLFLGGLSKGVDRRPSVEALSGLVRFVICFGKEAHSLADMCKEYGIAAQAYGTLEEAFNACVMHIQRPGDHVLFSPAGASYDLFEDYIKRGERFIQLVQHYIQGR